MIINLITFSAIFSACGLAASNLGRQHLLADHSSGFRGPLAAWLAYLGGLVVFVLGIVGMFVFTAVELVSR